MNSKFKYGLILLFLFIISCVKENKTKSYFFTESEIKEVIDIFEQDKNTFLNSQEYYNLKNNRNLNDHTFMFSLIKSYEKPLIKDGLSKVIKYGNSYIFYYDKRIDLNINDLDFLKDNKLLENKNNSLFLRPDNKIEELLIEKVEKHIIIRETKVLLSKSSAPAKDSVNIDF